MALWILWKSLGWQSGGIKDRTTDYIVYIYKCNWKQFKQETNRTKDRYFYSRSTSHKIDDPCTLYLDIIVVLVHSGNGRGHTGIEGSYRGATCATSGRHRLRLKHVRIFTATATTCASTANGRSPRRRWWSTAQGRQRRRRSAGSSRRWRHLLQFSTSGYEGHRSRLDLGGAIPEAADVAQVDLDRWLQVARRSRRHRRLRARLLRLMVFDGRRRCRRHR